MLTLPILMYHRVAEIPAGAKDLDNYVLPKQFDEQLTALSRWGYTPITIETWLDIRAGRRKSPPRPIALTFDDGYLSHYDVAWPLLRRHGATATMFLIADLVGGINRWDADKMQEPRVGMWEILAMQAGGICFGSHTCTHPSLIDISPKEVLVELRRSRAKLEALLRRPVVTLSYPYNKQNATVRALARRAGYKAAVLGRGRVNGRWTNLWTLRRIKMNLHTTVESLSLKLNRPLWLAWI